MLSLKLDVKAFFKHLLEDLKMQIFPKYLMVLKNTQNIIQLFPPTHILAPKREKKQQCLP